MISEHVFFYKAEYASWKSQCASFLQIQAGAARCKLPLAPCLGDWYMVALHLAYPKLGEHAVCRFVQNGRYGVFFPLAMDRKGKTIVYFCNFYGVPTVLDLVCTGSMSISPKATVMFCVPLKKENSEVVVLGNNIALGCWDVKKGFHAIAIGRGLYVALIPLSATEKTEFKWGIRTRDAMVTELSGKGNREIAPTFRPGTGKLMVGSWDDSNHRVHELPVHYISSWRSLSHKKIVRKSASWDHDLVNLIDGKFALRCKSEINTTIGGHTHHEKGIYYQHTALKNFMHNGKTKDKKDKKTKVVKDSKSKSKTKKKTSPKLDRISEKNLDTSTKEKHLDPTLNLKKVAGEQAKGSSGSSSRQSTSGSTTKTPSSGSTSGASFYSYNNNIVGDESPSMLVEVLNCPYMYSRYNVDFTSHYSSGMAMAVIHSESQSSESVNTDWENSSDSEDDKNDDTDKDKVTRTDVGEHSSFAMNTSYYNQAGREAVNGNHVTVMDESYQNIERLIHQQPLVQSEHLMKWSQQLTTLYHAKLAFCNNQNVTPMCDAYTPYFQPILDKLEEFPNSSTLLKWLRQFEFPGETISCSKQRWKLFQKSLNYYSRYQPAGFTDSELTPLVFADSICLSKAPDFYTTPSADNWLWLKTLLRSMNSPLEQKYAKIHTNLTVASARILYTAVSDDEVNCSDDVRLQEEDSGFSIVNNLIRQFLEVSARTQQAVIDIPIPPNGTLDGSVMNPGNVLNSSVTGIQSDTARVINTPQPSDTTEVVNTQPPSDTTEVVNTQPPSDTTEVVNTQPPSDTTKAVNTPLPSDTTTKVVNTPPPSDTTKVINTPPPSYNTDSNTATPLVTTPQPPIIVIVPPSSSNNPEINNYVNSDDLVLFAGHPLIPLVCKEHNRPNCNPCIERERKRMNSKEYRETLKMNEQNKRRTAMYQKSTKPKEDTKNAAKQAMDNMATTSSKDEKITAEASASGQIPGTSSKKAQFGVHFASLHAVLDDKGEINHYSPLNSESMLTISQIAKEGNDFPQSGSENSSTEDNNYIDASSNVKVSTFAVGVTDVNSQSKNHASVSSSKEQDDVHINSQKKAPDTCEMNHFQSLVVKVPGGMDSGKHNASDDQPMSQTDNPSYVQMHCTLTSENQTGGSLHGLFDQNTVVQKVEKTEDASLDNQGKHTSLTEFQHLPGLNLDNDCKQNHYSNDVSAQDLTNQSLPSKEFTNDENNYSIRETNPESYSPGETNPESYSPGETNPESYSTGETNPESYSPGETNPKSYSGEETNHESYLSINQEATNEESCSTREINPESNSAVEKNQESYSPGKIHQESFLTGKSNQTSFSSRETNQESYSHEEINQESYSPGEKNQDSYSSNNQESCSTGETYQKSCLPVSSTGNQSHTCTQIPKDNKGHANNQSKERDGKSSLFQKKRDILKRLTQQVKLLKLQGSSDVPPAVHANNVLTQISKPDNGTSTASATFGPSTSGLHDQGNSKHATGKAIASSPKDTPVGTSFVKQITTQMSQEDNKLGNVKINLDAHEKRRPDLPALIVTPDVLEPSRMQVSVHSEVEYEQRANSHRTKRLLGNRPVNHHAGLPRLVQEPYGRYLTVPKESHVLQRKFDKFDCGLRGRLAAPSEFPVTFLPQIIVLPSDDTGLDDESDQVDMPVEFKKRHYRFRFDSIFPKAQVSDNSDTKNTPHPPFDSTIIETQTARNIKFAEDAYNEKSTPTDAEKVDSMTRAVPKTAMDNSRGEQDVLNEGKKRLPLINMGSMTDPLCDHIHASTSYHQDASKTKSYIDSGTQCVLEADKLARERSIYCKGSDAVLVKRTSNSERELQETIYFIESDIDSPYGRPIKLPPKTPDPNQQWVRTVQNKVLECANTVMSLDAVSRMRDIQQNVMSNHPMIENILERTSVVLASVGPVVQHYATAVISTGTVPATAVEPTSAAPTSVQTDSTASDASSTGVAPGQNLQPQGAEANDTTSETRQWPSAMIKASLDLLHKAVESSDRIRRALQAEVAEFIPENTSNRRDSDTEL